MKKIISLTIGLGLCIMTLYGQDHNDRHETDDHRHHIGLAGGLVFVQTENNLAAGIHIHYTYLFDIKNVNLGTGLGFETILDEHKHYAASINLTYLPTHALSITVAPGLVFTPTTADFSIHFETAYGFEFNKIHIGPTFEFAYAKDDIHLMLGLHIGFGL